MSRFASCLAIVLFCSCASERAQLPPALDPTSPAAPEAPASALLGDQASRDDDAADVAGTVTADHHSGVAMPDDAGTG
ncbi:MAG: hypothetical protein ACJ790_08670, partial [Myxococcaceae bacterium]